MSGIMNKIGETLHMGGNKKEEEHKVEHKGEAHKGEAHKVELYGEHKPEHVEHKEGLVDKIKDKIHGEGDQKGHGVETKKKKKEKKKHEDGHHSSSSSDSD